jgi:hypothetical protein
MLTQLSNGSTLPLKLSPHKTLECHIAVMFVLLTSRNNNAGKGSMMFTPNLVETGHLVPTLLGGAGPVLFLIALLPRSVLSQ